MPKNRKQRAVANKDDVYERVEDLPGERKTKYDSILEDFSRQMDERIERIYSDVAKMQSQVRSQFKVALMEIPRDVRSLKAEDFYYQSGCPVSTKVATAKTTDEYLASARSKIADVVASSISNEVTSINVVAKKGTERKKRMTKKKSSILAAAPNESALRRSTRKRIPTAAFAETPLASSTLTAAALGGFSMAPTPANRGGFSGLGGFSMAPTPANRSGFSGLGMITPKFDLSTPMNKNTMRAKANNEKWLISMNGSPVYVGGCRDAMKEKKLTLPMPDGKTLVVPADDPDVQPFVQKLYKTCLAKMDAQK